MSFTQKRVLVGVLLAGGLIGALFSGPLVMAIVTTVVMVLSMVEPASSCLYGREERLSYTVKVGISIGVMLTLIILNAMHVVFLAIVVMVGTSLISYMIYESYRAKDSRGLAKDLAWIWVLYIYFPLYFLLYIYQWDDGITILIYFFSVVAFSDVGAWFSGKFLWRLVPEGKMRDWWQHNPCKGISPKKTNGGFLGGTIIATSGGVALALLLGLPEMTFVLAVVFSGAIVIAATLGDLVVSMIKRTFGIKDFTIGGFRTLGSHGGLWERLDSAALACAPLAAYILTTL